MKNGLTPDYLTSLLPNTVAQTTHYPLRNAQNYNLPLFRLSTTQKSFLPSSLRSWNILPNTHRLAPSLKSFKNEFFRQNEVKCPTYFGFGERKINILHCKLRNNCSSLNNDLFRVNLVNNPQCNRCRSPCENAYHFFFECCAYNELRNDLFLRIANRLDMQIRNITINLLLCGCETLPVADNIFVFQCVQGYIKLSNRF